MALSLAGAGFGRRKLIVVFRSGFAPVEFFDKQLQLIGAQLLAFRTVFGFEELAQQPLGLVQLGGQIDEHLLQDLGIFRQAFAVDRHCNNCMGKRLIRQAENASRANVYAASTDFLR